MPKIIHSLLRLRRTLRTALLVAVGLVASQAAPNRIVKVGVFPHVPAISMGQDGVARGFYVDMLQEVAAREHWELQFVPGTWQQGLDRIRTGEIDLISSAARTPEREAFLDFSTESSFTVWSILYAHPKSGIRTILDVQNRRIGLMRGDVNGNHFRELCAKFALSVNFEEFGNFEVLLRAVEAGQVDGGVVVNTFGYSQESRFKVERTPVVFNPFDIYFAVRKGHDAEVLRALDSYLREGKPNQDSGYHRALKRWLTPQLKTGLPPWVHWVGFGITAALALAVLVAMAFKRQVAHATAEIRGLNEGLEKELAGRLRREEQILHMASGVSGSYGETFFHELVRHLAQATGADVAFVGEIIPGEGSRMVRTLAVCIDHAPARTLEYPLAGTPCERAFKGEFCVIPQAVQEQFSQPGFLKDLGAQGYIGAPLVDSQNAILGHLAVLRRTPIEAPGEALSLLRIFSARAAAELERRKSEAARQVLERQMQHAQKLESLGVLAGGIAHDFNNLLTAMLGHLNVAQAKLAPESPAHPNLESLERVIHRAADLTRQMLAYSGKGRFVVRPYDLNHVVQEVTHLLEVSIPKKIALRFDLAPNLPPVEADAAQIQQVIMNLVTNAADAIGNHEGTIRLTTGSTQLDRTYLDQVFQGQDLRPGAYVTLEVSDTGCGMAPKVLERIFEPFFTTKVAGRGLGLSATMGILKGHRAGMRIYSEPGHGTTFKLLFPTGEAGPAEQATPPATIVLPRKATILLVDDEEMIRDAATAALESLGLTVITAENGLQAVEAVQRPDLTVDLVLMDLTMPQMDGREAFQAIHRSHPNLPVILCSGYNEQESIQAFTGRGLAAFLQKPYTLRVLEQTIQEVLARSKPIG
jgi:signal transduction histidine kinase/ABC-type amino acid transport substrate-binding protein/ActR/RegA family two-component response regulator